MTRCITVLLQLRPMLSAENSVVLAGDFRVLLAGGRVCSVDTPEGLETRTSEAAPFIPVGVATRARPDGDPESAVWERDEFVRRWGRTSL